MAITNLSYGNTKAFPDVVTIIGQIMPGESDATRTTPFIERTERVLWSFRGQIPLGNVGVCWEMICDIAKGSVDSSSSAHCQIRKGGYAGRDAWKQHRHNPKNTL